MIEAMTHERPHIDPDELKRKAEFRNDVKVLCQFGLLLLLLRALMISVNVQVIEIPWLDSQLRYFGESVNNFFAWLLAKKV
jgi:hypothetical protein